jgi:hypothetical protein
MYQGYMAYMWPPQYLNMYLRHRESMIQNPRQNRFQQRTVQEIASSLNSCSRLDTVFENLLHFQNSNQDYSYYRSQHRFQTKFLVDSSYMKQRQETSNEYPLDTESMKWLQPANTCLLGRFEVYPS